MELHLSLFLFAFFFQQSQGFELPSLSASSLFLPTKGEAFDVRGIRRFLLLQNDVGRSEHGRFALAPHLKVYHSQPSYPAKKGEDRSTSSPLVPTRKNHHFLRKSRHVAPEPYHELPRASNVHGIAPAPSPTIHRLHVPSPSPAISPMGYPTGNINNSPSPLPSITIPAAPRNQGCRSLKCSQPLTYTPHGSTCGCVWPIEVSLRFSVSLFTIFPLVSELAKDIASSIPLNRSQVRVVGADAVDRQLEKTTVLIHLIPLHERFAPPTALAIFTKFWRGEISVNISVFGAYEVLYVRYPGLPKSPPPQPSNSATLDIPHPPYHGSSDGGPMKPLGVDVPRRRTHDYGRNVLIIVVMSSVTAFILLMGFVLAILSQCGCSSCLQRQSQQALMPSDIKPSGSTRLLAAKSMASSASMSFGSSVLVYTGAAKVFSAADVERATDNFSPSKVLGEGGSGLVYGGILDDGREVAIKVLKRDDQQSSREFLAEVEMLGRLHHRNLVKLIGICAEDQCRCLVYELIPNGSVESHLHGVDKETGPLNWCARMKIALGSACGLAYLHEDSSPRVIHRDFKSSNILLEHDYTPKVSDFGLARAAMEEGSKRVSTHVVGTFGYLAPEYAMTGHLLVKSDVYSFGVVLLELLTGRKPVDFSQPPGQENLVAWALPLVSTKEGLSLIIDPALTSDVPLDNFAKVVTIASMCVQPEVAHRPFMGEVVQALKLVCNEFEETRDAISRSYSEDDMYMDIESKHIRITNELIADLEKYDSGFDDKVALSGVDLKSASVQFRGQESESFRRQFNSAPLRSETTPKFWQRLKTSRGSMSEHEFSSKF